MLMRRLAKSAVMLSSWLSVLKTLKTTVLVM